MGVIILIFDKKKILRKVRVFQVKLFLNIYVRLFRVDLMSELESWLLDKKIDK